MIPSAKHQAYILRCEDRFGDYGIVGMCVIDRQAARVRSFMMSCRVQRKRVEQSFFGWLAKELRAVNAGGTIEISHRRTERNQAVVKMLEELGFEYHPSSDTSGIFTRPLAVPTAEDDVVEVIDLTAARSKELTRN